MSRVALPFAFILAACAPSESSSPKDGPVDADGDGLVLADDCDDTDATVGGAEVTYDGIDNDCDAATPDDDLDGDGRLLVDDCDDDNPLGWLPDSPFVGTLESDFEAFCPGYCARSLVGDLHLDAATPADVASLTCLTAVDGDLTIDNNPTLIDLTGLGSLTSVTNDQSISHDAALTTLSGLDALTQSGSDSFAIIDDPALVDISAIASLRVAAGGLYIGSNLSLRELPSFDSLTELRDFGVFDNPVLGNLGWVPVTSVRELDVYGNGSLVNLAGLEQVDSADAVYISDNGAMTSLDGLSALTTVDNGTTIVGNPVLTDLSALDALVSVGEDLYISDNSALKDLPGFASLQRVGDGFAITGNPALADVTGFNSLIGASPDVWDNAVLSDISGFRGLETAGSLRIYQNDSLVALSGFTALSVIAENLMITDNPDLCVQVADDLRAQLTALVGTYSNSGNTGPCD